MKSGGGNSTVVHMHVQGGSMRITVSKTRCMLIAITLIMVFSLAGFSFAVSAEEEPENDSGHTEKIPVKVLILPKFEVGELSGDFSGEAQFYFEHYLDGAEEYEIPYTSEGCSLYIKDGVAMCLTGMGKVRAALNTAAVLSDSRFDFTDAYILSTGCAGSAVETSVMGDVFVITAAVDYDLGHHADSREMEDDSSPTWFHDSSYDSSAAVELNPQLMDRVYSLVEDLPLKTTEQTRNYMACSYEGAEWAVRDPKVQRGTTVTADNYWKGQYGHENAKLIVQTYQCPDPYATTEMEDVAVCQAVKHMGLLDRLIILRDSVNMDGFMAGATPESLWDPEYEPPGLTDEDSVEAADIFETAMENNFVVGSTIIDAILQGDF